MLSPVNNDLRADRCRRPAARISLAVILIVSAVACGRSPTQPSWDGQVRVAGFVRDFQTNAASGGARVTIGAVTTTTDPNGAYALLIPAGHHDISVDDERIGSVTMQDPTYRGDIYVHVTGCVARYGTVVDKRTRLPVAGATVSIGARVATDQTGWFRLALGCPGVRCVGSGTTFLSITHPDYVNGSFVAGRGICGVSRVDYELEPR